jgi:hypothetical protein
VSDIKALTAPFPPDRVSWRVGSTTQDKRRGLALAYIDARDVMERLDRVCGPENWQSRYPHATGKTVCEIGIKIGHDWIWKADGAGDTEFEADKGALSDAFKRAAVRWGIGRYLYDIEAIWVDIEPAGRSYRIAPHEQARLRAALGKGKSPAAPQAAAVAKAKGFHLLNPATGKVSVYDRGANFLEALEAAMRNGNPGDWWGANGTTARLVATLHPQAVKRVEQLEELAMAPAA